MKKPKKLIEILNKKEKLTNEDKLWLDLFFKENYYDKQWYKNNINPETFYIGRCAANTKCIRVLRTNGVAIPISYTKCLKQITPKSQVNQILRILIQKQINNFRRENPIRGNYHVDHIISFKKLVNNWMELNDLTFEELNMLIVDGKYKFKKHNKSWKKYHKRYAKLQYLTPSENYKKGSK